MSLRTLRTVNDLTTDRVLTNLQKQYMQVLCSALILFSGVGIVAMFYGANQRGTTLNFSGTIVQISLILFASFVLILLDRNRLSLSAQMLIYATSIAAIATLFMTADNENLSLIEVLTGPYLIVSILALITSAVLSARFDYFITTIAVIGAAVVFVAFSLNGEDSLAAQSLLSYVTIIIFTQVMVSIALRFFVGATRTAADSTQRINSLLEASAIVGQSLSRYLNTDHLFQHAIDIIRDRFGYYHVQIFIVDEATQFAELKASTGDIGQIMLNRQHKLAIGSRSVIGRVTQTKEIVVTDNTRQDEFHAYNELLPDTRSEIAVPILDGDRLIGALDVQSLRPHAFNQPEQQALTAIASQLAVAIRNARLFQQQQQSIQENVRLLQESEENLNEIKRLNSQLTHDTWQEYIVGRQRLTGVTLQGERFAPGAEWTNTMSQAAQQQKVIITEQDDQRVMAVPISLRDQIIGAIEVETDAATNQIDAVAIIEAIAERLALSLDNARLFEETQEASINEQVISTMVTDFQSTNSLQDLLQTALVGLTESLGANTGTIRLSKVPTQANYTTLTTHNGTKNGHQNGTAYNGNGKGNGNGYHANHNNGGSHPASDGGIA
ncbi:GAF domain-containing protein [Phototrophicus methaneseepsis]|uniref:GAF domain-containing protein n=1 Tax=Phototrophicus methaneseepsis TaxID=2710758 RepID=A0A7S8IF01_9CHLR|nr:GAF domain-containing protein [Phototrophicus methaneseepsis]QPC82393.1 GAF domain-containing protein [Phototrophicus methaneseepsis]